MYNCIHGIPPKRRKEWKKEFDMYFANINMVGVLPKKKKLVLPRLKYESITNIGQQSQEEDICSMLNTSLWLTMHINGLVKLAHCQKKYTMGNAFRVENEFFSQGNFQDSLNRFQSGEYQCCELLSALLESGWLLRNHSLLKG